MAFPGRPSALDQLDRSEAAVAVDSPKNALDDSFPFGLDSDAAGTVAGTVAAAGSDGTVGFDSTAAGTVAAVGSDGTAVGTAVDGAVGSGGTAVGAGTVVEAGTDTAAGARIADVDLALGNVLIFHN